MKLLTKINRYFALYASLVFLLGGIVFYFILKGIIREETSEVLIFERDHTLQQINASPGTIHYDSSMEKMIIPIEGPLRADTFKDTLIAELDDTEELIPYRQLTSYRNIKGQNYQLILRESLLEEEDMIFAVFISLLLIFGAVLLGLLLVNRWLSRRIWQSFYENLEQLRGFDVIQKQTIKAVDSDIAEFNELNGALLKMTGKIEADYQNLKEFTENASHEIQTPLAVIRTNLELLMNELQEETSFQIISKIDRAAQQVTRINQTLLLLSKIENQQFNTQKPVSLKERLLTCLENFQELAAARQLTIKTNVYHYDQKLSLNPTLIDILCNNLVSNAIKHNVEGGWMHIYLDHQRLEISNAGLPLTHPPEKLFERFKKENVGNESPGLGLALVQKICDTYQWRLIYRYDKEKHILQINF